MLRTITPDLVPDDVASLVTLQGSNFRIQATSNISTGKTDVDAEFGLVLRSAQGEVVLGDVEYVGDDTLQVIIPPGLSPGIYDAQVQAPLSDSLLLADALEVVRAPCVPLDTRPAFVRPIVVENLAADLLAVGYTVTLSLDHASLVSAGKSRSDGADLRIVWCSDANLPTQLARVDEGIYSTTDGAPTFGTGGSRISFALPEEIAAGASRTYYLHYGDLEATGAPAEPAQVYDIWEPFDDLADWTSIGSPGAVLGAGVVRLTTLNPGDLLVRTGAGATRDVQSGFAVRTLARQIQTNNDLGPIGWYLDETSGQRYDIAAKDTQHRIRRFTTWTSAVNVGQELQTIPAPLAATWYVYESRVLGSDFVFLRDGEAYMSASDATLGEGPLFIGGETEGQWDWYLVRQLADPEPTATVGAEKAF